MARPQHTSIQHRLPSPSWRDASAAACTRSLLVSLCRRPRCSLSPATGTSCFCSGRQVARHKPDRQPGRQQMRMGLLLEFLHLLCPPPPDASLSPSQAPPFTLRPTNLECSMLRTDACKRRHEASQLLEGSHQAVRHPASCLGKCCCCCAAICPALAWRRCILPLLLACSAAGPHRELLQGTTHMHKEETWHKGKQACRWGSASGQLGPLSSLAIRAPEAVNACCCCWVQLLWV